jgi:hypothetical protein
MPRVCVCVFVYGWFWYSTLSFFLLSSLACSIQTHKKKQRRTNARLKGHKREWHKFMYFYVRKIKERNISASMAFYAAAGCRCSSSSVFYVVLKYKSTVPQCPLSQSKRERSPIVRNLSFSFFMIRAEGWRYCAVGGSLGTFIIIIASRLRFLLIAWIKWVCIERMKKKWDIYDALADFFSVSKARRQRQRAEKLMRIEQKKRMCITHKCCVNHIYLFSPLSSLPLCPMHERTWRG